MFDLCNLHHTVEQIKLQFSTTVQYHMYYKNAVWSQSGNSTPNTCIIIRKLCAYRF